MKTFSGIILSSKVTILHFSHKNVGMISHTLYFFYNNSLLHGHENYRTLIFVVIDFDPEKIERKGGASFLAFSIYQFREDYEATKSVYKIYSLLFLLKTKHICILSKYV